MTILITGAFGFVGSNLSAYLAESGYELWALDLLRPPSGRNGACKKREGRASGSQGDEVRKREAECPGKRKFYPHLCDHWVVTKSGRNGACKNEQGNGAYTRCFGWDEMERIPWGEVDAVVHLAGKAHDTRNASDPQSYFDVNVGLTRKLLDAWMDGMETTENTKSTEGVKGVISRKDAKTQRKFILFSSVKAVADRVEGVLTEEAVPDPQTPYGQSKLEAEKEAQKFGNFKEMERDAANCANTANIEPRADGDQKTHECPYYILRPCMIHGPGNKGNLNLLYGVVRRGIPWPLGTFENQRSFASIGNVCAVVEGLLTKDVAPGVYQVADDEALSTNELVRLIADASGRRARVWRMPIGLMRALARIGDVLRLPLNSERLKKLTESYVVSNGKIKKALGWERMPVDAREGLRRTIIATTQWSQWGV